MTETAVAETAVAEVTHSRGCRDRDGSGRGNP